MGWINIALIVLGVVGLVLASGCVIVWFIEALAKEVMKGLWK